MKKVTLVTSLISMIVLTLILICSLSHADVSPDSNAQLMYADKLFDDSLYEASVLEFKRYIFYNVERAASPVKPETEMVDYAYYRMGQAYYNLQRYDNARQTLNKILVEFPESPLKLDAKMMLAKTYFEEHNYPAARRELRQLLAVERAALPVEMECNDRKLRLTARYMRGWCYLYEKNWYPAIIEFRKVSKAESKAGSLAKGRAGSLARYADGKLGKLSEKLADTLLSGTRIPRKSPSLARWMSRFIPGSGQIYAGRFLNGLTSMLLNGTFIYLLADSITDKRYVDAVGIYLVGARFYFGNVHNAEKFVNDYNRKREEQLIKLAENVY